MPFDSLTGASLPGAVCPCADRQRAVIERLFYNTVKSRIPTYKLTCGASARESSGLSILSARLTSAPVWPSEPHHCITHTAIAAGFASDFRRLAAPVPAPKRQTSLELRWAALSLVSRPPDFITRCSRTPLRRGDSRSTCVDSQPKRGRHAPPPYPNRFIRSSTRPSDRRSPPAVRGCRWPAPPRPPVPAESTERRPAPPR